MERLVIQSDIENIEKVENYISRFCDTKNIYNYFSTISMPVLHAVENAIIFGNKNDISKQVIIECGECKGGVYFQIQDFGDGFDWNSYGNMPEKGREGEGIFMMKLLSDKMVYSNGGRILRLEFYVQGIDVVQASNRSRILQTFFELSPTVV